MSPQYFAMSALLLVHSAPSGRAFCKPLRDADAAVFVCESAVHNSFVEPWNNVSLKDIERAKQQQCAKVRSTRTAMRERFYGANKRLVLSHFPQFNFKRANDEDWFQVSLSREICPEVQ